MEVKTCEEYVLGKLHELEEENTMLRESENQERELADNYGRVLKILQELFVMEDQGDGKAVLTINDQGMTDGTDPMAVQKIQVLMQLFGKNKDAGGAAQQADGGAKIEITKVPVTETQK